VSGDGKYLFLTTKPTNYGLAAFGASGGFVEITEVLRVEVATHEAEYVTGPHPKTNQFRNHCATQISVSSDGNLVAFEEASDDLIDDDTNEHIDIFLFDMSSG
jgi:hypothetical protein